MKRRSVLTGLGSVMTLPLVPGVAKAADNWPSRTITLVQTVGPGGPSDLSARALARYFEPRLNVPVIVKNIAGGSGAIGAAEVARSAPDGYTILSSISASVGVFLPLTSKLPFDPWTSFDYVCQMWSSRLGLVVPASSSIKTVEDLINTAKERELTYSALSLSQGQVMYKLTALTGARFRSVNTNNVQEAILQAAGGQVDATVANVGELQPLIDGGQLRLLASVYTERLVEYPEVKTLIEMGYNATALSPSGIAVPAGTPTEIVKRLETLFAEAAEDPEIVEYLTKVKHPPVYRPGAEFKQLLQTMAVEVTPILEELGQLKK